MAKSIIQKYTDKESRECYFCRQEANENGYYGELKHTGLQKHHVFGGHKHRKLSEHYGLWCYLCVEHHEYGPKAVHLNAEKNLELKQRAQWKFEKIHGHDKWMEEFGKNYL